MDNFKDYKVVLRRAEEVGEFLSEVSGSAYALSPSQIHSTYEQPSYSAKPPCC